METQMFSGIASENLVWNEYWNVTVGSTAAITTSMLSCSELSGSFVMHDVGSVVQYKGTARLTGSYSYVGLTKSAALEGVETLAAAYTKNIDTWAIGLKAEPPVLSATPPKPATVKYCYVQKSSAPMSGADVRASQMGGDMWRVDVDVDAYVERYFEQDAQPSREQLTAMIDVYKNADNRT